MNKPEDNLAIPIRPSMQAMEYMTGWGEGATRIAVEFRSEAYERGYKDGISSRLTQWEIAKKLYPLNKETSGGLK